jgi:hypothetical protein
MGIKIALHRFGSRVKGEILVDTPIPNTPFKKPPGVGLVYLERWNDQRFVSLPRLTN